MFNFKYSLKTLFRNRLLVFWTFAFPIIMATLFNVAFSNISNSIKFDAIDIAIVQNDDFEQNQTFKTVFRELSDESSENRMFNTKYVSQEEADKLLKDEKIVGYMKLEGDNPKVTFVKNGMNQTIFKYVVEEIAQKDNMITNIVNQEIAKETINGNQNVDINEIVHKASQIAQEENAKIKDVSNKKLDVYMVEFYSLIAMACLYGGIFGMNVIDKNLANMSNKGKRISVSPMKKSKLLISSLLAGYFAQLLGIALLFAYTMFALKVDYGDNIGLIILLAAVGSFAGLSVGVAISSFIKANENTKIGILIAFTMLWVFLAGMMGVSTKYQVDKNVPILNKINPANMITDGYYSLYYYDTLNRYIFNVSSLLIFAFVLIIVSIFSLRRQKYDSI